MAAWLLAFHTLCAADATTTHYALSHGYVEGWMPIQNPIAIDVAAGGQAVAVDFAARRLHVDHPKAALWLTIGVTAARAFAVAHNVRELRR